MRVIGLCLLLLTSGSLAGEIGRLVGVFQDIAGPAWNTRHGIPSRQWQARFEEMSGQGLRLKQVSGYQVNDELYFVDLWHRESGPAWQSWSHLTSAQYQQKFNELSAQGYRPVYVDGYGFNGEDRYSGIWEKRAGTLWVARHRMTSSQYQSEFNKWVGQEGFRLIHVSGYGIGGQAHYAAIFEKSEGPAWRAHHGMTGAQYQSLFDRHKADGFYPKQVSGFNVGGTVYYAAIWDNDIQGAYSTRSNVNVADYQGVFDANVAAGRRLTYVDGYKSGTPFEDPGAVADRPVIGIDVPELAIFDSTLLDFVQTRDVDAASLCITRGNKVIYKKSFGWMDRAHTVPVRTNALFRIASLAKPLTAAAIRDLIKAGRLRLSDRVFTIGNQTGLLNIDSFGEPDPRIAQITVQHLLDHKGGWDRQESGDPMFMAIGIANTMGVDSPPSQEDFVRYVLGRDLDHPPGTTYAYSNFGYLVLGLIVEKVTSKDYTQWLQEQIMAPLGVAASDLLLGASLSKARNAREPFYEDPATGKNVFRPAQTVPFPDGAFYLEAMEAHGGLICTAEAYALFLTKYDLAGRSREPGDTGVFYGSLPGTTSVAILRPDGTNIVALFNWRNDPSGADYFLADDQFIGAHSTITNWPTNDVRTAPVPPVPATSQWSNSYLDFQFRSLSGHAHWIESTRDLQNWSRRGPIITGDGNPHLIRFNRNQLRATEPSLYFRIVTGR